MMQLTPHVILGGQEALLWGPRLLLPVLIRNAYIFKVWVATGESFPQSAALWFEMGQKVCQMTGSSFIHPSIHQSITWL